MVLPVGTQYLSMDPKLMLFFTLSVIRSQPMLLTIHDYIGMPFFDFFFARL